MKGKKGVERSATTGRLVGPLQLLLSEAARDKLKYKLVFENKRFQSGDDDPDLEFSHLFLDLLGRESTLVRNSGSCVDVGATLCLPAGSCRE